MEKPALVILAAGMGSRYGGLKQIDPVDENGHVIIDFSIYDAIKAGFDKIVFIIKKEIEDSFKEKIGNRIAKHIKVEYVYQEIAMIPAQFKVPDVRKKPWGTSHALLCCKDVIKGPFAVINSDDFYGRKAFELIYDYLANSHDDADKKHYVMIGYKLRNTLTENGSVARGVCETNDDGYLTKIVERTKIEKRGNDAAFTEDEQTWTDISGDATVSMNLWGFSESVMPAIESGFTQFLKDNLEKNPAKCEYFIPLTIDGMINSGEADVKVITTPDKWFGVTYHEDKPGVEKSIKALKDAGVYPERFLED